MTPTPQDRHAPFSQDPRLLSLLPMLYVAWADGVLETDELAGLRARVSKLAWLDADQSAAVEGWLDPSAPPTATDLQQALQLIRTRASELPSTERRSLADMGLEMVRARAPEDAESLPGSETCNALRDLESALGVVSAERARELLVDDDAPPTPDNIEDPPAFDVAGLQNLLDGDRKGARDRTRAVLALPALEHVGELNKADYREQVLVWLKVLAEHGLGDVAYPGVTSDVADLGDFIATFQTLAFFDQSLVVKFGVQFGLFGGSVYFLGTEKHQKYLPDIAKVELPGCFAMTERGHGSNVRGLQTTARFDPTTDTFEIHTPTEAASKDWIGNAAAHARLATVFAQLETDGERHGVHAFLVPIRDESGQTMPGVRIEDCGLKSGLNGVDNGRLWFDKVRIPRDNLLDRFGQVASDGTYTSPIASRGRRFFTMLGTLVAGRVSVASAAVNASKVGLAVAIRYGAKRRQFGPSGKPEIPILDYRAHQKRLMPRLARIYAMDFALQNLVQRFIGRTEEDEREVEALAAALKALATWENNETLQVCREACGGQGYLSANLIPALRADTDVYATFEGDNTVLLQLVAKARLTAWRQKFMDDKVFGVLRYLADTAGTAIAELNPVAVRQTDAAHLRDPDFLTAALRYREQDLTRSLGARLKKRLDSGMDAFDAFNDCQEHVIALAKAWGERMVHEPFAAAVAACEDPAVADMMGKLCALNGLWTLERDIGWFLEHGYVSGAKSRAIRKEVSALCLEVRGQALPLIDAFGIPEQCLGAPIIQP